MPAKIKCPYTYSARSRIDKVRFITGIEGYSCRHCRYPIEFTVGVYLADLSFGSLWEKYRKDNVTVPEEEVGDFLRVAKEAYARISTHLYDMALEDCQRDIDKREGDTYFMLWSGKMVDVDLSLQGRCGKHLVIERFRSLSMAELTEGDLYEYLMGQTNYRTGEKAHDSPRLHSGFEWDYDNEFIDTLYRYCVQCVSDFTTEKASANLEYYAADYLFSVAFDDYEAWKKGRADHESVVSSAQTLRKYLTSVRGGAAVLPMLRTVSQAAGVSEEELCRD